MVVDAPAFLESAQALLNCLYFDGCVLGKGSSIDVAGYANKIFWFGMRSMPSKQSGGSRWVCAVRWRVHKIICARVVDCVVILLLNF